MTDIKNITNLEMLYLNISNKFNESAQNASYQNEMEMNISQIDFEIQNVNYMDFILEGYVDLNNKDIILQANAAHNLSTEIESLDNIEYDMYGGINNLNKQKHALDLNNVTAILMRKKFENQELIELKKHDPNLNDYGQLIKDIMTNFR